MSQLRRLYDNVTCSSHGEGWQSMSVGVLGNVDEASWSWEKTLWMLLKSFCLGWEGSAIVFPAWSRLLEAHRPWKDVSLQPITFLAEWMICWRPAFVLGSGSNVPDGNGGHEDLLRASGVEVDHRWLWQVELLQMPLEINSLRLIIDCCNIDLT